MTSGYLEMQTGAGSTRSQGDHVFSVGIRNPHRSVLICVAITLVAFASIAWGVFDMQAAGQETLNSGLKIGLALLPAILAPLMALNFFWGMKVMARVRRGEKAIARWSVAAADLAEFAAVDKARDARGFEHINDWSPPREPPSSGIEVIFVPDAVLVGDTYFSLANKGFFRFTGVRMLGQNPPVIAFQTVTTYANRFGTRTTAGELRIPVAPLASAEAARIVTHFEGVGAGKIVANPDFYRRRVRFGLIGAPIFLSISALGLVLGPNDVSDASVSIPSLMLIIGLVAGIAMLILALAASLLGGAQRRKP